MNETTMNEMMQLTDAFKHIAQLVDSKENFEPRYASYIEAIFEIRTLNRRKVNEAFLQQYGAFVVHLVSKRNKVGSNARDIVQELCKQLLDSLAVEKFFDQVRLAMPETITALQAHRALGVTFWQFRKAIWNYLCAQKSGVKRKRITDDWMPLPVEGSPHSEKSLYKTEDIIRLSTMNRFRKIGTPDHACLAAQPTKKHFQAYLAKCVHNRFANFCRSEDRHHKERIWDTFSELRPAVDDSTPWEARHSDMRMGGQEEQAELGLLIRRLDNSPAASFRNQLFELMDDGYSLEESINKLDLPNDAKKQTLRAVDGWLRATPAFH